ncbi:MAG TPA: hypothetical protein PKU88_00220 [Bacillota bacterium]|nr:hypothetical protein [Bacillota bacterium]HNT04474.1 hypothetical protein [Bacillota bacterium]HPX67747.1 hypothetical protein [Bacillota bacterium]HQA65065.1 hypothetical protein [Bacillota bacterium]HQO42332.1 hypothetical protein [Bacillota bacterium]
MGIVKDRIINMLGRSIKNAMEPEIIAENTKKAMKRTIPAKYINNYLPNKNYVYGMS